MAKIARSAAVCTFIVGLQLATLALAQPAMRPATQPAVGETLSDFKLNRLDGKQIQLSELTGSRRQCCPALSRRCRAGQSQGR
jgi:hypothetical protein